MIPFPSLQTLSSVPRILTSKSLYPQLTTWIYERVFVGDVCSQRYCAGPTPHTKDPIEYTVLTLHKAVATALHARRLRLNTVSLLRSKYGFRSENNKRFS